MPEPSPTPWSARCGPPPAACGLGALYAGHRSTVGRERLFIAFGTLADGPQRLFDERKLGLVGLAVGLVLVGLLEGLIDVGVPSLRQRRTDPDWLGRVLAISISFNTSGLAAGLGHRRNRRGAPRGAGLRTRGVGVGSGCRRRLLSCRRRFRMQGLANPGMLVEVEVVAAEAREIAGREVNASASAPCSLLDR